MSRVLVTGGNRGLGLEFVRQYARDGWEVYGTARDLGTSGELQKLAAENPKVKVCALDIASDESVEQLTDALDGKPLDVLILNSGIYSPGRTEDRPDRL